MKNLLTETFYAPTGVAAIAFAAVLTIGAGWLIGMSGLFPLSDEIWPVCDGSQCVGYAGPHTVAGFFAWGIAVWAVIGIASVVVRVCYIVAWCLGAELVQRLATVRHKGGATR